MAPSLVTKTAPYLMAPSLVTNTACYLMAPSLVTETIYPMVHSLVRGTENEPHVVPPSLVSDLTFVWEAGNSPHVVVVAEIFYPIAHSSVRGTDNVPYLMASSLQIKTELTSVMRK